MYCMALMEISMALWFIFFGFSVFFGTIMIKKAASPGLTRPQREYCIGIGIFILVHLVARILYFCFDFIYIADEFYWTWGAIFGIVGLTFLLYAIERNIFTQSKFLFTIFAIISVILFIVLPSNIGTIIQMIVLPILGLPIPLFYFYIASKSTGEIRTNSLLNGLGVFIFLAGQVAHTKFFYEIGPQWQPIYFVVSPPLMLIGTIIFFYGLVRPTFNGVKKDE